LNPCLDRVELAVPLQVLHGNGPETAVGHRPPSITVPQPLTGVLKNKKFISSPHHNRCPQLDGVACPSGCRSGPSIVPAESE